MTGSCDSTSLKPCALIAVIALACLAGFSDLPNTASEAAEPGLLPELEATEPADGALPAGPLLKAAEANTPARLDDEATNASQPISPRPMMCCRPAPSAAQDARSGARVHPTLAALAEAVRSRRKASYVPAVEPDRPPVAPVVSEATGTAAKPNTPASKIPEPEPLRNDSLEIRSPLAAPAERQPQRQPDLQPEPKAHSAPLTIANPWAARLAPVAPKEPTAPPAREEVKEPMATPKRQPNAWKSAESRDVRLARYHRAEAQPTANFLPKPPAAKTPSPPPSPELLIEDNPLRDTEAQGSIRGSWSSATPNPLR